MDIQLGQPLKVNEIKSLDEIEIQGKKWLTAPYVYWELKPNALPTKQALRQLHNATYTNSFLSDQKHFNPTPKPIQNSTSYNNNNNKFEIMNIQMG